MIFGLIAIISAFYIFQRQESSVTNQTSVISPTPNTASAIQAIRNFNKNATNIEFTIEYDDPNWGGIVQDFRDSNGARYRIDRSSNHVVFFLSEDEKGKIGSNTTLITASQAEQIGLAFAQKNIIDFTHFTKTAKYSFTQDTAPKMNSQFQLTWIGQKPGIPADENLNSPKFQSIVVLDKYGNVISFQNEYITEVLGR